MSELGCQSPDSPAGTCAPPAPSPAQKPGQLEHLPMDGDALGGQSQEQKPGLSEHLIFQLSMFMLAKAVYCVGEFNMLEMDACIRSSYLP